MSYYSNDEESYISEDEEEKEEREQKRKDALVAKWTEQSETLRLSGNHIYTLTLRTDSHRHPPEIDLIGVFNSKAAAVAKSVKVDTPYGTFDEAIRDMFGEDNTYIDNRENPPDNGVLIQLGHEYAGEGETTRLVIKKCPVIGMVEPEKANDTKKRPAENGSDTNSKKKKHKKDPEVIVLDDSDEEPTSNSIF